MLSSLESNARQGKTIKPKILVLEIRDKKLPAEKPIAWLIVERTETYETYQNGEVGKASICLSYRQIFPFVSNSFEGKGEFTGCYSKGFNLVSLTAASLTSGFVTLDLPNLEGQRIGTYLMNEIVQWVQQWPEAIVGTIELLPEQATPDNKIRRNRFYEQFNLKFEYIDNKRSGKSLPIKTSELTTVENWKENITEHHLLDYLADVLLSKQRALSDLEQRDYACKNLVNKIQLMEARPIIWALKKCLNA